MPDESTDERFARLQHALQRDNEKDVHNALWSLSAAKNGWKISDEIVERLLTLLRDGLSNRTPFSGDLLHFFEMESKHLTDHQKWLCICFLNALGDEFTDGFSSLVVGELRRGLYLKMKKPNPQQWDDYQKMQRGREKN
jgi:hypothetical protein